jgi:ABC-type nitrate/sulfonate/bicarbonate transport system substrate-binding protein
MMAPRISRRRLLQAGAGGGLTALAPAPLLAAPLGKPERSKLVAAIPVDAASFLPIYLAADRTWKQQGLDIELTAFRGDAEVSQALIGGSIDFSIQSADGLINMINAGQPVIAFYAGFHQSDYAWLSQPSIKNWDALRGKTAGVSTFGSATDQLTRYALRRHGLLPEKDIQIMQAGPPASIAQALKAERLAIGILAPPMNWIVADQGFNILGSQGEEIAPQWPKHVFVAKKKFLDDNPNTVQAILRAQVTAIRLGRTDRDLVVATYMSRLKFQKIYAERAYDAIMPGYEERGALPNEKSMAVFWSLQIERGEAKEPWPNGRILDDRFIRTFADWAP